MFDPNLLFYKMLLDYKEARAQDEKIIICNEGGTRSGKTWSEFDLITWICDHNRNKELDIYILRDTLIHCRDFTLKDFIKLLRINGFYDPACYTSSPKPYYRLFGNNVYFRGLDDETSTEGYPSDILFFNEVLETEKNKVDALKMRCRQLIMMDWNPKLTKHWVFDYEGQENVKFYRTTFKDNKHLEQTIIDEILSYEPTPENIANKTANLFRWKVYGLGVRTDQEGNVFNDSQLNKFDLSEIDITNQTIIAYGDIADQGIDYFSMPIGVVIKSQVYVIDWIFTPKPIEYWMPLVIEKIERYNISRIIFESNNQGLVATKFLKDKLKPEYQKRISASPNSQNKHSRIVIQAETNIIPNFHFLRVPSGQYADAYDFLLSYKHDKTFKQDDAPDSLAGLSSLQSRIK